MMDKKQFEIGMGLLKNFLKKIEVDVEGKRVVFKQYYEFPEEIIAKSFAKSIKEQFEGGT